MPDREGKAHEKLTHLDAAGRPRMVDVTDKPDSQREAVARGEVLMQPETFEAIQHGTVAKGDVLATAQVAGIMAAKKTWEIIPMCHPLLLTGIQIEFELDQPRHAVKIRSTVRTTGKTGVEMEALTAVGAAALTIYDMCKAIDKTMQISGISLARKSGGKSGTIVLEGS